MKSAVKNEITLTLDSEEARNLQALLTHEDKLNADYYRNRCDEILRALNRFLEK